jgi:tetratricopeptide (TPR) repeat protein
MQMKLRQPVFILLIVLIPRMLSAQLITMSNKCYNKIKLGNQQLDSSLFDQALNTFSDVLAKCSARDAKEQGQLGKARALNGLHRYDEAVEAANASIAASKNKNVMAYYTRSYAYRKSDKKDLAMADLQRITDITGKNKNIKARATIFAQMADIDWQEGMNEEALKNLSKAIQLDDQNPSFYVQRGDIHAKAKNYDEAFSNYDKAIQLGKNDLEIYRIRTYARIRQMQQKYHTDNANTLSGKMNASEKELVCKELSKALELGLRNIQMDLLSTMICK